MTKRFFALLSVIAIFPLNMAAQFRLSKPFNWEYDADFSYIFDNREFSRGGETFATSCTLNGVVLQPSVGFSIQQKDAAHHRIMLGADILHQMGNKAYDDSYFMYYDAHIATPKGGSFEGVVGAFPRSFLEGEYGKAFFSDSVKFYDRVYEGVLLKYARGHFFTELTLDWMGMKGVDVKERFQILSSGNWCACPLLDLGWQARFYHYAGSLNAPGVVDNHLLYPYAQLNLGHFVGLEELSFRAAALLTYQRDRKRESHPQFPVGGELITRARHHSLGLENTFYAGQDLMPYYSGVDLAGNQYGYEVYHASPFYRGLFNRTELFWEPKLTQFVSMRFGTSFYVSAYGYEGCQQLFSLVFDLDAFRHKRFVAGRLDTPSRKRSSRLPFKSLPDSSEQCNKGVRL